MKEQESLDEEINSNAKSTIEDEIVDQAYDVKEEGLQEEIEELDKSSEIERWKELTARSQAELDNYRKRVSKEKLETIQYANREFLEQILPIIDNFEMGLDATKNIEGEGKIIVQGMSMVHNQIKEFLSEQGVKQFESDGEVFDPNIHEAIKEQAHDSIEEGKIISTSRKGYYLRDKVLRAANVIVSSGNNEEPT